MISVRLHQNDQILAAINLKENLDFIIPNIL